MLGAGSFDSVKANGLIHMPLVCSHYSYFSNVFSVPVFKIECNSGLEAHRVVGGEHEGFMWLEEMLYACMHM